MASLDSIPPDQRAVLQLVLARGRGYDEIADLLAIDRAAVRLRAMSAFDALGPRTRVPAPRRALITDYLLGQLPDGVSVDVRDHLAASAGERAWARVIASELSSLAKEPLPEIPDEAPATAAATGEAQPPAASPKPEATRDTPEAPRSQAAAPPASSRRGGAILLGVGALVAVAVVIVVLATSGSGGSSSSQSSTASTPTTASTASTPATSTPTTSTTPRVVAQINLLPPSGSAKGIAEILRQGASSGIAIVAQGIPPNTRHDAYAVWLYNSPTDSRILGFVNPGVTKTGRLSTAGGLPADARHFKHVLITRETQQSPHAPGPVLLQGNLTLG